MYFKKIVPLISLFAILILLNGCSTIKPIQDGAPDQDIDVSSIPNAVPKVEPQSRYGNPRNYEVNGHRYHVLKTAKGYNKKGVASWYGTKFHGQLTSTREIYNMFAMTAASTELPLPTYARVTNLQNGRHVIVKVNDRGPFDKQRILDLSYAAAKKLGVIPKGTALVQVTALDPPVWQNQQQRPQPHSPQIFLQLGAFSSQETATQMQNRVTSFINEKVRIIETTTHSNSQPTIYKVQIGPLTNVAENDKLQKSLETHGFHRAMTVVQ